MAAHYPLQSTTKATLHYPSILKHTSLRLKIKYLNFFVQISFCREVGFEIWLNVCLSQISLRNFFSKLHVFSFSKLQVFSLNFGLNSEILKHFSILQLCNTGCIQHGQERLGYSAVVVSSDIWATNHDQPAGSEVISLSQNGSRALGRQYRFF